jgi:hypothetical protein
MVVYLCKGDSPELCKECFPDAHTPRFFLYEQVFKLCYAGLVSKVPVMRLLTSRLSMPYLRASQSNLPCASPPCHADVREKGTHVQPRLSGPSGKVEKVQRDADRRRVVIGRGGRGRIGICIRRGTREGEETVCVGCGPKEVGCQLWCVDDESERLVIEGTSGEGIGRADQLRCSLDRLWFLLVGCLLGGFARSVELREVTSLGERTRSMMRSSMPFWKVQMTY